MNDADVSKQMVKFILHFLVECLGGWAGLKSSDSVNNGDVFASFGTSPKHSAPIEDLLGNLGGREAYSKSSSQNGSVKSESDFDDLIPGFCGSSSQISTTRDFAVFRRPLDTASSRMQTSAFGKSRGLWKTLTEGTWTDAFDGW